VASPPSQVGLGSSSNTLPSATAFYKILIASVYVILSYSTSAIDSKYSFKGTGDIAGTFFLLLSFLANSFYIFSYSFMLYSVKNSISSALLFKIYFIQNFT